MVEKDCNLRILCYDEIKAVYGIVCIQLTHSSLDEAEDKFATHLIII